MSIRRLVDEQNRHLDAVTNSFRDNLERLSAQAQARVVARLGRELDQNPDGTVQMTPANQSILRRLDRMVLDEMDAGGYPQLLNAFLSTFVEQLPLFQEAWRTVSERLKAPLPPLRLTQEDQRVLVAQQAGARALLRGAVRASALKAQRQATLTVGAIPYPELVTVIAAELRKGIGESEGLAATSISVYYRTIAGRGFAKIEQGLRPDQEVRYRPIGPLDRFTRGFCRKLMKANRAYTRAEINAMNNQCPALPSAWLGFGGFRCRHHWMVDGIYSARAAA